MKHWVIVEVLQVKSITVKAQLISKFIDIALVIYPSDYFYTWNTADEIIQCLRDYGNFQSAICIIEALASLQFLDRTWEVGYAFKSTCCIS